MHPMSKTKPKKAGRPPKEKTRDEYLEVRLDAAEKKAFNDAAELAGTGLSAWVRERLRLASRKELESVGKPVAFLKV